jgi:23S rRNA (guanosine2251-2'-O)-methyltransferase
MKPPHKSRSGGPGAGQSDAGRPERAPQRPGTWHPPHRQARAGQATKTAEGGQRDQRRPAAAPPATPAQPERPRQERLTIPKPPVAERATAERPTRERPGRPVTRGGQDAPRGGVWLYGSHAIAAALANPGRRLRRLMLTEDAEAAIAVIQPKPWPVPAERTDRARLDQLLGRETVHQGAALLADPLPQPALAAVLERPGPVLVLDQITDPRNVGAILRSAAAFGVAAVIAQERNAPEETGALAKAASGALERVPLLRAVNIARTLIALKAAGCWVVGLDAGSGVLKGEALAQRRVALVLGNEGEGLRRLTRDTCDEIAGIAMPGSDARLDSLNVSAAAAIALYELGRA